MKKPILTIGIPTYNHGHFLKECLAAITVQFSDKDVFDTVEVFVSDNASQDDTCEIVEGYQKKFSNIRYSRNNGNIGFDRNIDMLLTNTRGKFCWTLSSNDYLRQGSIKRVLSIIQQAEHVAFLCVSNRKEDADMPVMEFTDGRQLLKDFGLAGGQISQCIFNMKYIPNNREKHYDNMWFHLSLSLEMIVNRPILLLPCLFNISDKKVFSEWAKDGGGGQGLRTYINLKKIIENLPQYGYDTNITQHMVKDYARGLPRIVASAKINNLPVEWNRFVLMSGEFYKYPLYLGLSIIVFLTPPFLLRLINRFK